MKRKDWIIKYSLEFVIIVVGITTFWLNEVSINNQNNKERIKVLNSLLMKLKSITKYCSEEENQIGKMIFQF